MTFTIETLFTSWPWLPLTLLIAGSGAVIWTIIEYRKRIESTLTNYLTLSALIAYIGTFAIGKPLLYLTQSSHLIDNLTLIMLTTGLALVALMDELPMPFGNNLYKKLQPTPGPPERQYLNESGLADEDHFNAVAEEPFPSFEEVIA